MKFFTSAIVLLCIGSSVYSQTDTTRVRITRTEKIPKRSDYNTWTVGLHGGLMVANTDIAEGNFNTGNLKGQSGYGINVNKFFSHSFALEGRFVHGHMEGKNASDAYGYKTTIDWEGTINAVFHLGNISFLKRSPKFGIYGYLGIGVVSFRPVNYHNDTLLDYNFKVGGSASTPVEHVDYNPSKELVIPFGVGMRYRFTKHLAASLEYSLRTIHSDKLDGWYRLLSSNDNYSYVNMGITYGIGKKEKTIEWVNPLNTIYADLYDTKEKVEMMTGDQDQDGVADMFDKDNSTPEGAKVYGDGTAVDSDNDGVPDNLDVDPFSAKGAKVDAHGRELDSDGDGVPDSRDREPNTPKGSLVDYNGINLMPLINQAMGGGGKPSIGGTTNIGGNTVEGSSSSTNNMYTNISNGYFPSIYFEVNSAVVDAGYDETLADIALVLLNNPALKIELDASCDVRGGEAYNNGLSNKRSKAVMNHLVKKYNIDASRFVIVNKGKSSPITYDHAMNRRVDFKVSQ